MSSPPRFKREHRSFRKYEGDTNGGAPVTAVAQPVSALSSSSIATAKAVVETNCDSDILKSESSTNICDWPVGLRNLIVKSFDLPTQEAEATPFLKEHEWPVGLQKSLFNSCKKIPIRFFIVDDSGSMGTSDGKRVVGAGSNTKVIECTRWAEVTSSLMFHAELAEKMRTPTEFRLLNGADPIIVGLEGDNGESLKFLKEVFDESPGGKTPLCAQIAGVVKEIKAIQDVLRSAGKKACVVIVTDGEATDGDVAAALKPLEDLPVWVVIRLCTDEVNVIKYWQDIDRVLELELDVLDDVIRDTEKIDQVNPWLNYSEPLHRVREFGSIFRELDIINESKLTSEQMRAVCATVFTGGNVKEIPHPDIDWPKFLAFVRNSNSKCHKIFHSTSKKYTHWINIEKLIKVHGDSAGSGTCTTM